MKLNLPKDPLVDAQTVASTMITGGYNLVKPREVLTDEVMDIFSDLKLKPKFVTLFGFCNKTSTIDTRLIHTDLQQQPDLTWKKLLFGINWEIGDAENILSWWDMDAVKACYPGPIMPSKYKTLNGIHYVDRFNLGIPEGAVKLDETTLTFDTGPTLVRTDVAHMAVYKSKRLNRVGVSVRFDESQFDEWSDVVDYLNPVKL